MVEDDKFIYNEQRSEKPYVNLRHISFIRSFAVAQYDKRVANDKPVIY